MIVVAGEFQTPQLLMLSGVGDGEALGKHGIASVHHLPGVGQNLRDHPDFVFSYMSDNPNLMASRSRGCCAPFASTGANAVVRWTSNFAECGGFLKTRPDFEVPDVQLHSAWR